MRSIKYGKTCRISVTHADSRTKAGPSFLQPQLDPAGFAGAAQQEAGQRPLHLALNQAAQLSGAILSGTFLQQERCQFLGQLELNPHGLGSLLELTQIFPGNGLHGATAQRGKGYGLVNPPQEFRRKGLPQRVPHLRILSGGAEAQSLPLVLAAHVGGHHHNGVFEADPAAGGCYNIN